MLPKQSFIDYIVESLTEQAHKVINTALFEIMDALVASSGGCDERDKCVSGIFLLTGGHWTFETLVFGVKRKKNLLCHLLLVYIRCKFGLYDHFIHFQGITV